MLTPEQIADFERRATLLESPCYVDEWKEEPDDRGGETWWTLPFCAYTICEHDDGISFLHRYDSINPPIEFKRCRAAKLAAEHLLREATKPLHGGSYARIAELEARLAKWEAQPLYSWEDGDFKHFFPFGTYYPTPEAADADE
jgi:hypothetical protein